MSGQRLVLFIGALLGAIFLYLAVERLGWHPFATVLAGADLAPAALALATLFGYFAVKAMRWAYPAPADGADRHDSPAACGARGQCRQLRLPARRRDRAGARPAGVRRAWVEVRARLSGPEPRGT